MMTLDEARRQLMKTGYIKAELYLKKLIKSGRVVIQDNDFEANDSGLLSYLRNRPGITVTEKSYGLVVTR